MFKLCSYFEVSLIPPETYLRGWTEGTIPKKESKSGRTYLPGAFRRKITPGTFSGVGPNQRKTPTNPRAEWTIPKKIANACAGGMDHSKNNSRTYLRGSRSTPHLNTKNERKARWCIPFFKSHKNRQIPDGPRYIL